jgi:protein-L-isoaspartate O-methyltransferase
VVPVGKYYQHLTLITKNEKGITKEEIIAVRFVPMVNPE